MKNGASCKQPSEKYVLLNNIGVHILILFLILSSLFIFYISKTESTAINNEILTYVNEISIGKETFIEYIAKMLKSNKTTEKSFVDGISDSCKNPGDSFPCDSSGNDKLGGLLRTVLSTEAVKSKIDTLIDKINDSSDNTFKDILQNQKIDSKYINTVIEDLKTNKHRLTEEINMKIKEEMCIVIGFLILVAILLSAVPIKFFNYCNTSIVHILFEMLFVFVLIFIIEVLFFMFVASKYSPVQPSLIITAFKNKLLKIIN